jgi:hypothetical protein
VSNGPAIYWMPSVASIDGRHQYAERYKTDSDTVAIRINDLPDTGALSHPRLRRRAQALGIARLPRIPCP